MGDVQVILGLLAVMGLLLALAQKLEIPYPILLVMGGLAIGLVSLAINAPSVELAPDIVFLLFLPPIIQDAAFFTPMRDFKRNLRSIGLLAVGLVLFTTIVVAVVARLTIGLPWAAAFVLGAIVAPPDAAAATSIGERLRLPRRLLTVLEGESLLNDATSIVAYRVAVVAVTTGAFSVLDAGWQFVLAAAGGIAIGLAIGWLSSWILLHLRDTATTLIATFLSGYATYLIADTLHTSGVLAVVAMGFYFGRRGMAGATSQTRVQVEMVWESVVSLINGVIFILIGLQLPTVLRGLRETPLTLTLYALAICLAAIIARIVWVPIGTYLPRYLSKKLRERDPYPRISHTIVVSWTGMRGVVSLASALSLPLVTNTNVEFPGRDLIIFLTFCVILATLVLQGLSLPAIIRWLHVEDDGSGDREITKARWVAAKAGQERLTEIAERDNVSAEIIEDLSHHYDARIRRFSARYHGTNEDGAEEFAITLVHLQEELLDAENVAVVELRNRGVINDATLRRVERDLDLERIRLSGDHDETTHTHDASTPPKEVAAPKEEVAARS